MQILEELENLGKRMRSADKRNSAGSFTKHLNAIYKIAKAADKLLNEGKKLGYEFLPVDEIHNGVQHIEANSYTPGVATRAFCMAHNRHEFLTVQLPVQKPSDVNVETWIGPQVLDYIRSLELEEKMVKINSTAFQKMANTTDDTIMKACVVSETTKQDRLLFNRKEKTEKKARAKARVKEQA